MRRLAEYCADSGRRYVEPFCGSAALFYHLLPARAVLGDLNGRLINFYQQCALRPVEVWSMANDIDRGAESYYRVRDLFNEPCESLTSAAYFYFLNRTCFNGIFRTNAVGRFNVPYSGSRMPRVHSKSEFIAASRVLSSVEFVTGDFEETIFRTVPGDSFYFIDPPYLTGRKRVFNEYTANSLRSSDIGRLVSALKAISDGGGRFVCTYDVDEEAIFSGMGWRTDYIEVHRNVGGFSSSRRRDREVVVTNVVATP